jgi:hypothetical protein
MICACVAFVRSEHLRATAYSISPAAKAHALLLAVRCWQQPRSASKQRVCRKRAQIRWHSESDPALSLHVLQAFGAYASSVKNTIPTSRGFDFYTYANEDPYVEPGNEPDADKFNARAYRSFEYLMKRAERLEKLVRSYPPSTLCPCFLHHAYDTERYK